MSLPNADEPAAATRSFGHRRATAAIGLLAALAVVQAARSTGYVWDDDYTHLLLSRAALDDWRVLLDIWGRPLNTLVYVPGGALGDVVARATSLGLLAIAAFGVHRAAGTRNGPAPMLAVLLLLIQPLTLRLGYSAMPQILFTAVLACALALRAMDRHVASCLAASLLPLARIEGAVVLAVLAALQLREGRARLVPLLGLGVLTWASVAWVVHGDPLWLLHANPWTDADYAKAGPWYLLVALPAALGPVVPGLALVGLLRGDVDPAARWSLAALSAFYVVIWTVPGLPSFGTPLYLVCLAAPAALAAREGVRWIATTGPLGQRLAVGIVTAGVALALVTTTPISRDERVENLAALANTARSAHLQVTASSHPAFTWFTAHGPDGQEGTTARAIVWDAKYGAGRWGSLEALVERGLTVRAVLGRGASRVALLSCQAAGPCPP